MLRALAGTVGHVVASAYASPRALDAHSLAETATAILGASRVTVQPNLTRAITEARRAADPSGNKGVFVTGSVMTAGEASAMNDQSRSI